MDKRQLFPVLGRVTVELMENFRNARALRASPAMVSCYCAATARRSMPRWT